MVSTGRSGTDPDRDEDRIHHNKSAGKHTLPCLLVIILNPQPIPMSAEFVPISITQRAAEEIRRTLQTKNIPEGYGLRVGVKGGGCGVTPLLGFDKRKEDDQEFIIHGIPVYVNKKQTLFVVGKEIDFYDGADERGFLFR